jgi:hypothetical protein
VVHTAKELARLAPDSVKIHSLYITKETALAQQYRQGDFTPLKQEEFVSSACDVLELLPPETIIQRLTGDPRRDELIAPQWALRKQETLDLIHTELERRQKNKSVGSSR